jgi:hypothetical protein
MCVVATGNLVDGFALWGPFDDADAAGSYAEEYLRNAEWWIIKLVNPEADA